MKPNVTMILKYIDKEKKERNITDDKVEEFCNSFCEELCREFLLDNVVLEDDEEILMMNNAEEYYNLLEIYDNEYTKKELSRIAEYYDISRRKKKKNDLIDDIVTFELNLLNSELVERRKRLWGYIEEIKIDKFLSKYLILD